MDSLGWGKAESMRAIVEVGIVWLIFVLLFMRGWSKALGSRDRDE